MLSGFLVGKNEYSRFVKKKYCNGSRSGIRAGWNIHWCKIHR